MGGTDDPSNLIELTPEEHAEAHRVLYEQHGHWQDYVAWQGLAKLTSKQDHVKMLLSAAGKKGNALRKNTGLKYNTKNIVESGLRKGAKNPSAKTYTIIHPNQKEEVIKSLKTWCEANGLNYNTFHRQCVGRQTAYKGYRVKF